jgi:hypothetical protein
LAIQTGATVIGNYEAINILRKAGVPDKQLHPVSGGERIPLFTKTQREAAFAGAGLLEDGLPLAPKSPHPSLAVMSIQAWPSLHCLIPGGHDELPEIIDTGKVYSGEAHPYECTIDMNKGMKYGLLKADEMVPREQPDEGLQSFIEYMQEPRNYFSPYDGGQMIFNFIIDGKALLWNAHLGCYEGITANLDPKPEVAILGIVGRGNLDGKPFDGSAATFALREVQQLGQPKSVIWCLHDEKYFITG